MEFSDVAFFRLGFFDYAKLNVQNMLARYEASKWYAVDLVIDWDDQRVSCCKLDFTGTALSYAGMPVHHVREEKKGNECETARTAQIAYN